ncbi:MULTISPECIES: cytochrome b [unclassified Sinorhizobium]|uniref:cytochrome b n=1 Tax=unclassified Sinorhizobium TaxID=2613772 RepID=UPI0035254F3B
MACTTTELTSAENAPRYDRVTIALHWATAILVTGQFTSAHIWEQFQRGTSLRLSLISTHIAFGILLAAVIIARICWRFMNRGKLPPAVSGLQHVAASTVHFLLYGLLICQVALGFTLGWAVNLPLSFFGLFTIPQLLTIAPEARQTIAALHNGVAWAIIAIAGIHAAAALLHHYVLRDHVLLRMIPQRRRRL